MTTKRKLEKHLSKKGHLVELCLCEQNILVLKPDTLYIFRVCSNCAECAKIVTDLGTKK